jgi:hypothetical protein
MNADNVWIRAQSSVRKYGRCAGAGGRLVQTAINLKGPCLVSQTGVPTGSARDGKVCAMLLLVSFIVTPLLWQRFESDVP